MAFSINAFISSDTAYTAYLVWTTEAHTLILLIGQSFFSPKIFISTRKQIAILPSYSANHDMLPTPMAPSEDASYNTSSLSCGNMMWNTRS